MVTMKKFTPIIFIAGFISHAAVAGVCEYTPSKMIKSRSPAGFVIGAKTAVTGAAVVGAGMKAAGFYTLTHSVTGATMLASTASGSSAAGTIGIIGGTGSGIGAASAILMSPFFIVPAAITTLGIGIYEGGCYIHTKK